MKSIEEIRLDNARELARRFKTLSEFARIIERSPTQVSRFMGKNPTKTIGSLIARDIEAKFGLATGYLDNDHSKVNCPDDSKVPRLPPPEASNVSQGPTIKGRYPLISWVAAGTWSDITELPLEDATLYPCPVACSARTFVLRVQGISMDPAFRDGELIFIDPAAEARHGSYVVARLEDENEATFKQLIIEGGQKYLKPANPNWPEQITPINGNCTIVGSVVFAGRVF